MLNVKCLSVGMLDTNCYIVYNNLNNAVIIDPGADSAGIIKNIDKLKLKPECVIFTHAHFDHIGAGNDICSYYNCYALVNINDEMLFTDGHLNLSQGFFGKDITFTNEYKTFDDGDIIKLIGESFRFISTPGHTNGSCCVEVGNLLFTGDTLFRLGIGNAFPPYGNTSLEISSIKDKLFVLDDHICYPGHGDATTLFFEKKNNPYF